MLYEEKNKLINNVIVDSYTQYYKLSLSGDGRWLAVCIFNYSVDDCSVKSSKIVLYERDGFDWVCGGFIVETDVDLGYKVSLDYYGNKLTIVTKPTYVYSGDGLKITTYDISNKSKPFKLHEFTPKHNIDNNITIFIPVMSKIGNRLAVTTHEWYADNPAVNTIKIYDWDDYSNEWIYSTQITSPDGIELFGCNLAMNDTGSVLAACSYSDLVYIYTLDSTSKTYKLKSTISNKHLKQNDRFGVGLDLNGTGDIITIGSYEGGAINEDKSGRVFVYRWNSIISNYEKIQTMEDSINNVTLYGSDTCLSSNSNYLVISSVFKSSEVKSYNIHLNYTI